MVMRKASEDTDQHARSLLQKAVRRGNTSIAKATFHYLVEEKKDLNWLRSRLAVMTFEEAWPYGLKVTFGKTGQEILGHYIALCTCEKHKNAAGIGSLAYALSEGDDSVLCGDSSDWYIRLVAKALKEREKFRDWISGEIKPLKGTEQSNLVVSAMEGSKKAGWPWDKAFAYAAALLALKHEIPRISQCTNSIESNFPFWTAIDKHTQNGKEAIRSIAKSLGIPANTALWLSFYCESAVCNNLVSSLWWERERRWRFLKLGLTESQAENTWLKIRPLLIENLWLDAKELETRISPYIDMPGKTTSANTVQSMSQQELF